VLNCHEIATLFSRVITSLYKTWHIKAKWEGQSGKTFHFAFTGISVEIISQNIYPCNMDNNNDFKSLCLAFPTLFQSIICR
jgi:hypothetical protein